jgi:pimeloyl-ACP methyl ester carboxylesterase
MIDSSTSHPLEFTEVTTNGVRLRVATAGPSDGPLVILLHGFPEGSYGWRRQIAPLAEAGYRVLAPDQRGYGGSEKPKGVSAYSLDTLVADVLGLIDASGHSRATVIGHDWGGVVAWRAIETNPTRFEKAVILNAPHPAAMIREVRGNLGQFLKSWYTLAFQIPKLPEMFLRRDHFQALEKTMVASSLPGTFSPSDLEVYKKAWSEEHALSSMLHWYRAAFRSRKHVWTETLVQVPTLLIWGANDRFLGPGVARASYAQCVNARLEWVEDATHWVQHERADRVNRLILDFLAGR